MAQPVSFEIRSIRVLEHYEIRFGRDPEGYFYEMEDLETGMVKGAECALSRSQFIDAVGSALEPSQYPEFEELIFSLG